MQHSSSTRSLARPLAGALLASAFALPLVASAAVANTSPPPGACTDDAGITVVVDLTDLGGAVEMGCATGAATGTEALLAAGFSEERAESGMICAINSLPDPCPEVFDGSYWSYWYAEDGEWLAWMEGSDTAVPAPGGYEGWRYNDGSAGPDVDPATLTATEPDGGAADPTESTDEASGATDAGTPDAAGFDAAWRYALIGTAVLGAALLVAIWLTRRGSVHGPGGQD